jgi:hypothetical protein
MTLALNLACRSAPRKRNVLAILDKSGSMCSENRFINLKSIMDDMVLKLTDDDQLCVVAFNTEATVVLDWTDMGAAGRAQAQASLKAIRVGGGTDILSGLAAAAMCIAGKADVGTAPLSVFLLTDGEDGGPAELVIEATRELLTLARGCARVDTVGLGTEQSCLLLKQIAIAGNGLYHFAHAGDALASGMRALMKTIEATALANVVVRINTASGTRILVSDGFPYKYTTGTNHIEISVGHVGTAAPICLPLHLKVGLAGDDFSVTCTWAGEAASGVAAAAAAAAAPAVQTMSLRFRIPSAVVAQTMADELARNAATNATEILQLLVGNVIETAATRALGDITEGDAMLQKLKALRESVDYRRALLESMTRVQIDQYLHAAIILLGKYTDRSLPSVEYARLIVLAQAATGRVPFSREAYGDDLPPPISSSELPRADLVGAVHPLARLIREHFLLGAFLVFAGSVCNTHKAQGCRHLHRRNLQHHSRNLQRHSRNLQRHSRNLQRHPRNLQRHPHHRLRPARSAAATRNMFSSQPSAACALTRKQRTPEGVRNVVI